MDDYGVDLEQIIRVIDRAEVLIVRMQVIDQRLLVDFRTTASEGPLVQTVAKVGSREERFRSLKALRPSFSLPARIHSFLWPRGLTSLEQAGMLDRIRERLRRSGFPAALEAASVAFDELRAEERAVLHDAIRGGQGFRTLWERTA